MFQFTADELLYLIAGAGADRIFGIEDRLSALTDAQLNLKILELDESLEKKGYLSINFDGDKEVVQEVAEILEICAMPEYIINVEKKLKAESSCSQVYFVLGEETVIMDKVNEEYQLSNIPTVDVPQVLRTRVTIREDILEKKEYNFGMSQKQFDKVSRLVQRDAADKAAEELQKLNCEEGMSQNIITGLKKQADFYSVLFMDQHAVSDAVSEVMFLQGKDLIMIQNDVINDENYIRFLYADSRQIQNALEEGIHKIEMLNEEETE